MVFIESPAGVGYSYDENCDYETSDNEVGVHAALYVIVVHKSCLASKQCLSGRSYGF